MNVRGEDSVPSIAGGLASIAAMSVLLVYSLMKMETLLLRDNPMVSFFVDRHSIALKDQLNLLDADMRFAVGFEGFLDHQLKNDTDFVRIIARLYGWSPDGKR